MYWISYLSLPHLTLSLYICNRLLLYIMHTQNHVPSPAYIYMCMYISLTVPQGWDKYMFDLVPVLHPTDSNMIV